MSESQRQELQTGSRRRSFSWSRLLVFLGVILLVREGVGRLGQRVEGALDAAGFLTGPGPDGLIETASLPILAVLVILFFRRDLRDERGLRLGAMGLGAGAGILLADPLARVILYVGMPDAISGGEDSALRLTVNLLVLAVVGFLFFFAVIRELRQPDADETDSTPDEE